MPVFAAAVYGEELARIILLAKEENNSDARKLLVELFSSHHSLFRALESDQIVFIPVPSSLQSNRKRGYKHSRLLADSLSVYVSSHLEIPIHVADCLQVNRRVADQTLLNRSERALNLGGAYSVDLTSLKLLGDQGNESRVFLVDDLVTTGASIREALRCLRQAGIRPSGAICAGVSPLLFS
jgi:predicted amidophosphoribosyltransferase